MNPEPQTRSTRTQLPRADRKDVTTGGCLAGGLPASAFEKYNQTLGTGMCWGVRLNGLCPHGGEHPFCRKECYATFTPCLSRKEAPGGFPSAAALAEYSREFLTSECPSDPADVSCAICGIHYRADLSPLSLDALSLHGHPLPPRTRNPPALTFAGSVGTQARGGEVDVGSGEGGVSERQKDKGDVSGKGLGGISDIRFMAYHAPLRTQVFTIPFLNPQPRNPTS
jgi:hypothetical protein